MSRPRRPPTLTLFCGPPGAGKSTLAAQLEAQGHGIRISTDDWQAALGVDQRDEEFHGRLQPVLYAHAVRLLDHGCDVILEDGLWMRVERSEKFADARAHGARISWHVFDLSEEELWARVCGRNAAAGPGAMVISRDYLARCLGIFEPPTQAELAAVDEVAIHR